MAACALERHDAELKLEWERCFLKSALGEAGKASFCSDNRLRFECERDIGPAAKPARDFRAGLSGAISEAVLGFDGDGDGSLSRPEFGRLLKPAPFCVTSERASSRCSEQAALRLECEREPNILDPMAEQ